MKIIKECLGGNLPDLDLGAGKKPKGNIAIDIDRKLKPSIVADVQHLPVRDEVFGSVVCSHVIEHVNDVSLAVNEMKRVLNKSGTVMFFLPDDTSVFWRMIKPLWSIYYQKFVIKHSSPDTHLHSFDYVSLEELVGRFFESYEIGKINLGMEMYAVCRRL